MHWVVNSYYYYYYWYRNSSDDLLLLLLLLLGLLYKCITAVPAVEFEVLSCVTQSPATMGPQCAVQHFIFFHSRSWGKGRGEGRGLTQICLLTCVSTSNNIRNNKTWFKKGGGFILAYLFVCEWKRWNWRLLPDMFNNTRAEHEHRGTKAPTLC